MPSQSNWTWCNRCQALSFAGNPVLGIGTCPAGGHHDHTGSNDYSLEISPPPGPGWQADWRCCSKCQSLVYDLSATPGPCSGGGTHEYASSPVYFLSSDPANDPGTTQADWRWCNKCQVLFYSQNPACPCAAGGNHDFTGSGAYRLSYTPKQSNWQWCNKCQALSFAGNRVLGPGACPAGGQHDHTASYDYSLVRAQLTGPGWQSQWCYCSKCQSLAFAGNAAPGPCSGGGTHEYASSPVYSLSSDPVNDVGTTQVDWRWCNKCQVLAYSQKPASPCAAGGVHDFGGSYSYRLPYTLIQSSWRWCRKCQALSFAGNSALGAGACPAGGQHDHTNSYDYYMAPSHAPGPGWQSQWRYCNKCQSLAFSAGPTPGPCSGGGQHDSTGSSDYSLSFDPANDAGTVQRDWRWCNKCQVLAYSQGSPIPCAAGGIHDFTGSAAYRISASIESNWRWCSKCQAVGFAGNPALGMGACPAGGTHDHTNSRNYSLARAYQPGAGWQSQWRLCKKCQGLGYSASAAPGPCPGGGLHDYGGSPLYFLSSDPASDAGTDAGAVQAEWRRCGRCQILVFAQTPSLGPSPSILCAARDDQGNQLTHSFDGSVSYRLPFAPQTKPVPDLSRVVKTGGSTSHQSLLAIGTGYDLWTRETPTDAWVNVPSSGSVIAVTYLPDGRILGVGMDQQLRIRDTLNSAWVQVPGSGSVTGVAVLPDGRILGLGTDQQLWTRDTLSSPWTQVPASGPVRAITVTRTGIIVGIGLDGSLLTRATLTSPWAWVANVGSMACIAALDDGSLVGANQDLSIYSCATLMSPWVAIPNGQVRGVAAVGLRQTRVGLDLGSAAASDSTGGGLDGQTVTILAVKAIVNAALGMSEESIAGFGGAALGKFVAPFVGGFVSDLIAELMGGPQDPWPAIQARVQALIDSNLDNERMNSLNEDLQAQYSHLGDYRAALQATPMDVGRIYTCFETARSFFEDHRPHFLPDETALPKDRAAQLLPLVAQFGNLELGLLREGYLFCRHWGRSADEQAHLLSLLQAAIPQYCSWVDARQGSGFPSDSNESRSYHLRQLQLLVLDFRFYWPFFDPTVHPPGTPLPPLSREIFSDWSWQDPSGLPQQSGGPLQELKCLSSQRLLAVQNTYDGKDLPYEGVLIDFYQTGYTVGLDNPITGVSVDRFMTAWPGPAPESPFPFDGDIAFYRRAWNTTHDIGLHPGSADFQYSTNKSSKYYAGQTLWSFEDHVVSSVHLTVRDSGSHSYDQQAAVGNVCIGFRRADSYGARQTRWRWCHRCQGLFYGQNATQGVCPAGGPHEAAGSPAYVLYYGDGVPAAQAGWRWCSRCQGLHLSTAPGRCPRDGGPHDTSGSNPYLLMLSLPGSRASTLQPSWRWCQSCSGLYYSWGDPSTCPARAGGHDGTQSEVYFLAYS